MKYRNTESITFASEELPTKMPNPHITLPREKLESFNETLKELGDWAAQLCGVPFEKLCTYDTMQFYHRYRQLQEKLADYERVLAAYAKRPGHYWSSGTPGVRDPMDGLIGTVSGYSDDYAEAREVIKKWKDKA